MQGQDSSEVIPLSTVLRRLAGPRRVGYPRAQLAAGSDQHRARRNVYVFATDARSAPIPLSSRLTQASSFDSEEIIAPNGWAQPLTLAGLLSTKSYVSAWGRGKPTGTRR